jgi:hypothetical protein
MKTSMRKYIFMIFVLSLAMFQQAYAGKFLEKLKATGRVKTTIPSKIKSFAKTGLGFIPGGGAASLVLDNFVGESQDAKLDGIFEGVVEVADDVMDLKRMTEDAYYRELQSRRRAQALKEAFKKARMDKLFGAALGETMGISLNPADYVPSLGDNTAKLKKNIAWDLDHEKGFVKENGFYLSGGVGATLISDPQLLELDPKNPNKYEEAKRKIEAARNYEEEFEEAQRARNAARVKVLSARNKKLEGENKVRREDSNMPGQTPAEVQASEQAISENEKEMLENEKEINKLLDEMRKLHKKTEERLAMWEAYGETFKNRNRFEARKEQIKLHLKDRLFLFKF